MFVFGVHFSLLLSSFGSVFFASEREVTYLPSNYFIMEYIFTDFERGTIFDSGVHFSLLLSSFGSGFFC